MCVCAPSPHRDQSSWEFHFHEVIVLGCALYIYTWLVPVVLSSLLWWRGSQNRYSLLELLSIYGYSISIFIPITVHCWRKGGREGRKREALTLKDIIPLRCSG